MAVAGSVFFFYRSLLIGSSSVAPTRCESKCYISVWLIVDSIAGIFRACKAEYDFIVEKYNLTVQLAGRKINRIKNATEGALRLRTFHCNLASVVTLRYFQLTLYVTVIIRADLNRIVKFSVNLPYPSSTLCACSSLHNVNYRICVIFQIQITKVR